MGHIRNTTAVRRWATVAAGMAVAMVVTAPAAQAAPASTGEEHCVVVLDKLRPGETTSRVVSRQCADTPEAARQKHQEAYAGAAAATLLLTLYADINYGGASTVLEGNAGACDTAGYGFRDLGSWRNRISSFKRFNWCQRVQGFDLVNYGGAAYGPWTTDTPWVGSAANDRIDSLQTRRL
ncbi:hypothetical protein [Catenuloplanes atrovinosus]|uniref:Uncharacterized protein n=1 Tax=Catenuloplanes atrovinosus TaxID=137266 RepID=A0AAE4C9F2_9ACTN|nr:hypothetical protein [Catenuloplanes atrovinosus]MDR7275998.1 hypothetical protein [Catenuloplanes atrovinosus]